MTQRKTATINDIHSSEAQTKGIPVLSPEGLGILLARPEQIDWLESQQYVAYDATSGVCAFTDAGAKWLESIDTTTDAGVQTMDSYFYRPDVSISDILWSFDSDDVSAV